MKELPERKKLLYNITKVVEGFEGFTKFWQTDATSPINIVYRDWFIKRLIPEGNVDNLTDIGRVNYEFSGFFEMLQVRSVSEVRTD